MIQGKKAFIYCMLLIWLIVFLPTATICSSLTRMNTVRSHQPHIHSHTLIRQRYRHHALRPARMVLKSDDNLLASSTGHSRPISKTVETTVLRQLRPYYGGNKVLTNRLHDSQLMDWKYNTYNIFANTLGQSHRPIQTFHKGEDNTQDVEVIDVKNISFLTPTTPPKIDESVHGIDDSDESDNINNNNTKYPLSAREMERRHICVQYHTITMPVKTTEVYTRPTWKHIGIPCQLPTQTGQLCTRVHLVHEQAYRDVIKHKTAQQVSYDCCNGWSREDPRVDSCMKPNCTSRCQNGGSCAAPQKCSCPSGYIGRLCEQDINECQQEKPCDQECINTQGSYYCRCRDGFILQEDKQSCKKNTIQIDDAFEAHDLENDVDTEMVTRLTKIERTLANERIHTNELQKSLQATFNVVDTLNSRLNTLEKQQQDMNRLQTNLYKTESRTNKLEGMLNLLLKCRNGPSASCP